MQIRLDKVVGMTELAQAVAATYLQEPDHARARPSRYFKKENYEKVFSSRLPMDLYIACALLRKSAEGFLRNAEPDRRDRNNLLFYVMMSVVCQELKTPRGQANSIASLKIPDLRSTAFAAALALVRPVYDKYGASDNAAKGTEMKSDLKAMLVSQFAKKKKRKV